MNDNEHDLLKPIIGIENRTPDEVFDIMCARIRSGTRANASSWHPIASAEDLPKEDARYLWQIRDAVDDIEFELRRFRQSYDPAHFIEMFVAWQKIAPYQPPAASGGGGETL